MNSVHINSCVQTGIIRDIISYTGIYDTSIRADFMIFYSYPVVVIVPTLMFP